MNFDSVFQKKEEIVSRRIAGETLLVPIQGKLANMQRIFALDSVSEFIWEQLDGRRNLKDILNGILDKFDVGKKQATGDLEEFIAELLEAGLIAGVT